MTIHNPLIATAADAGVQELRNILATAPDGPSTVAAIRAYLETPQVQDAMVKQILNLFRMVKITSAAESTLIDDALGAL
ncbi:MAG: hypothetical protein N0E59_00805 [Candidatus Thiodiazotropha taylori]|nr:hypothetical protein [Candidatus Thiodiazotropha taylori]MCG8109281.1 hypothetical protein [Candidatus Thiodiazotropha taylori]MCW4281619.1 hypothetical protein [Candidatus Thiodiazotropha taylori]MCW4303588.1 hypothetical protein [Candidatus Thiodiazotropha taylori]